MSARCLRIPALPAAGRMSTLMIQPRAVPPRPHHCQLPDLCFWRPRRSAPDPTALSAFNQRVGQLLSRISPHAAAFRLHVDPGRLGAQTASRGPNLRPPTPPRFPAAPRSRHATRSLQSIAGDRHSRPGQHWGWRSLRRQRTRRRQLLAQPWGQPGWWRVCGVVAGAQPLASAAAEPRVRASAGTAAPMPAS